MFHFLGCLLFFIIIIPLLLVAGVGTWLWNIINGNKSNVRRNNQGSSGQYSSHNGGSQNFSSKNGSYSDRKNGNSGNSHKQIFKDGEGEYVDFQEIDE